MGKTVFKALKLFFNSPQTGPSPYTVTSTRLLSGEYMIKLESMTHPVTRMPMAIFKVRELRLFFFADLRQFIVPPALLF